MPISVVCPRCNSKLRAPESKAGRRAKCPKCGFLIFFPEASAGSQEQREEPQRSSSQESEFDSSRPPHDDRTTPEWNDDATAPAEHVRAPRKTSSFAMGVVVGCLIAAPLSVVGTLWISRFLQETDRLSVAQVRGEEQRPVVPRLVLDPAQKSALSDALKGLGKVEAAVEVGVNYQQYTQLVIDAKAVVNEADRALPPSEVKLLLNQAIDAFKEAGDVWGRKIKYPTLSDYKHKAKDVLPGRYLEQLKIDPESELTFDGGMQFSWGIAAKKIAAVRALQVDAK